MINKQTNMKAVIYARVSSVNDRQNTDRQVVDLTQYAKSMGYSITKVFTEKISGAVKNIDRVVLSECIDYCISNDIDLLLVSELSRLGRNVFEVQENVKKLKDAKINIYFQKEGFSILDSEGKENPYCAIMIAVLGTCAQMERENIKFRLNSGRQQYIANGGKLGRKEGSKKTKEQKTEQYKKVLSDLKAGKSIRDTAKLNGINPSTVQNLKKEFGL